MIFAPIPEGQFCRIADGFITATGRVGGQTTGYWSRFCLSDDLGNWVGELAHQTGLCNIPAHRRARWPPSASTQSVGGKLPSMTRPYLATTLIGR